MNAGELLALLTARVQRFHLAPGGIPRITADDMAHALGMIKIPEAALYARTKFCGEPSLEELALAIRRYAMVRKADASWRIPRKEFLLDMCRLMVWEAIDPHTCTWCLGRAEVRPESGPVIVCDACRGTGQRRLFDSDRARIVGLAKSSWSDPWAERYREIQIETVDKWESIALSAVRRRLSA